MASSYTMCSAKLSPSPSPPLSSHGVVVALLPSPPMASLSFASSISLSNLPLPLRTHHHPPPTPPTPTAPTLFAAAAYGAKPYKGSVKRLWSPRGKKSVKRKRKKKQQLRLSKMVGPFIRSLLRGLIWLGNYNSRADFKKLLVALCYGEKNPIFLVIFLDLVRRMRRLVKLLV
ncbi:uncharacterized protein LOC109724650 [Ananas comosus]|uniref:Uncharacterized protein LOC109724650 n=1 Tax=Ananas comosus TaxID=4615 RepID=A0A6P5GMJ0_ANACO|nr:uncharacterized protein LOC109724650 [Ananas comosus]